MTDDVLPVRVPDSELWQQMRSEWLHLLTAAEDRIKHCMCQLTDEQLWWRPFDGGNSIGNQILHVCGNLQQWLVDGIRGSVSLRDRSAEFSATGGKTSAELRSTLRGVFDTIREVLAALSNAELTESRTIQGFQVTVLGAICHSIPHLVGHTHQITLLTRLQLRERYQFHWTPDGDRSSVPL